MGGDMLSGKADTLMQVIKRRYDELEREAGDLQWSA